MHNNILVMESSGQGTKLWQGAYDTLWRRTLQHRP